MDSVCAVIVTYNRKELLLQNVLACLSQKFVPTQIMVVDNHGSDNSLQFLKEKLHPNDFSKINYQYLDKNTGGSGGFNYGTELAYHLGFDYIWLMDDDGRPLNENTLFNLIEFAKKNDIYKKPFLINSLVLCDSNTLSFGLVFNNSIVYKKNKINVDVIINSINPFNGTLIPRELVDLIGSPRGDYFIKGDEIEYYMRAKYNNVPIYTVCSSLYYHPSPNRFFASKKVLGKSILNDLEDGWKEYYSIRNNCNNIRLYNKHYRFKNFKRYLKRLYKAKLFDPKNKKTISMIKRGYRDYKNHITGIVFLPGNIEVR